MEKIRKTRVIVEVLSPVDDPPPSHCVNLVDIIHEATFGGWSMDWHTEEDEILSGDEALTAIENQGSDPAFFFPELEEG